MNKRIMFLRRTNYKELSRAMLSNRNRMQGTYVMVDFLRATFRKATRGDINFSTMFYLT